MGGEAAFDRILKSGAFVRGAGSGPSSAAPKLMISTMLVTSFLMFSGNVAGNCFPTSFKLQRYIARANSGKCSCPDRVVSARVLKLILASATRPCCIHPISHQICDRELPSSLDRSNRSLDLSPDNVCPSPTADLNNVSNFAWSCAVMNDSRMFGILAPFDLDALRPRAGAADGVVLKLSAIAAKPVGCGLTGAGGGGWACCCVCC